uniref:A2 mating-type protein n=1 Tax=Phanerodontia chrysosporium TaxID=2822231 RepID=E7DAI3_PHACH|nr:A2 mating-type protein [Phanerodontia chrysosporium]
MEHADTSTRLLNVVTRSAYRILQRIGEPSSKATPLPVSLRRRLCDACVLPDPRPIVHDLLAQGVPTFIAERVSSSYVRLAGDLKRVYETRLRSCTESWIDTRRPSSRELHLEIREVQSSYKGHYLAALQRLSEDLAKQIHDQLSARTAHSASCTTAHTRTHYPEKRSFNQEALPILERAFQDNAYPTRAEKETLARVTNMEYRQIHVWFQNHRNRLKRDGQAFRTSAARFHYLKDQDGDPTASTSSIPASIATSEATARDLRFCVDCTTSVRDGSGTVALLPLILSEAHVYPAPYPPVCHYDPFSAATESSRLSLPWPYRSSKSCVQSTSVSIEELVAAFSRMSLRCSEFTAPRGHVSHFHGIGFTSHAPRAPLSALVRHTPVRQSRSCSDRRHPTDHLSRHIVPNARQRMAHKPLTFGQPSWSSIYFGYRRIHPYTSRSRPSVSRSASVSSTSSSLSDVTASSSTDFLLLTPPSSTIGFPEVKFAV